MTRTSMLLLTVLVAGCGTTPALAPAATAPTGTMVASKVLIDDSKTGPSTPQTTASKLGDKTGGDKAKAATPLKVELPPAGKTWGPTSGEIQSIATMTLQSMHRAGTYDSACKIGYAALERLNYDTNHRNMVIRFGLYAAKSQERWENAYKVQVLAFEHLRYGRPTEGRAVYQLGLNMMKTTSTYVDGSKAGYEVLETIQQADRDESARRIAGYAYASAKRATRWDDAYSTIANALQELADRSY